MRSAASSPSRAGRGRARAPSSGLSPSACASRGIDPLLTREPGGTEGAEAIRGLIVDGPAERWRPLAELYLFLAAREDHLHRAILPALPAGRWVLCDRFADSSRVYQGIAGELGLDLVDALQAPLLGSHRPDLTLVLDLPVAAGLARCAARGGAARFEAKGVGYHERVRAGFRLLADAGARAVRRDRRQPAPRPRSRPRSGQTVSRPVGPAHGHDRTARQPATCSATLLPRRRSFARWSAGRLPHAWLLRGSRRRRQGDARLPLRASAAGRRRPCGRRRADPAASDLPHGGQPGSPRPAVLERIPNPKTGKLYREILVDQVRGG